MVFIYEEKFKALSLLWNFSFTKPVSNRITRGPITFTFQASFRLSPCGGSVPLLCNTTQFLIYFFRHYPLFYIYFYLLSFSIISCFLLSFPPVLINCCPRAFYQLSTKPLRRIGEWRQISTHSLTSALDGSELSTSRPGRFTPRERAPGTLWRGGLRYN